MMTGAGTIVKLLPLLPTPPAAVTTALPLAAPLGTVTVILFAAQLVIVVALVPLKVTPPFPCVGPKFDPAITIDDPTAPVLGVSDVMLGAGVTVKLLPPLATPPAAVTTTLPVVAPLGTVAVILVFVQLAIVVALVPLRVTPPFPCVGPKFNPAITIDDPTAPVLGVSDVMLGAGVTVKLLPPLATPPAAVTTTLPVVAPLATVAVMLVFVQLVIVVAGIPLKVTALPVP
jgi:hypothetical protein